MHPDLARLKAAVQRAAEGGSNDAEIEALQDYVEALETAQYTIVEFRDDVQRLVDYNWASERRDFEQVAKDGGDTTGHIFGALQRVDKFLMGENV